MILSSKIRNKMINDKFIAANNGKHIGQTDNFQNSPPVPSCQMDFSFVR